MVNGFVAIRLLSTGVPSMMKMAVAPVSAIACKISFRHLCPGAPKIVHAVAANFCAFVSGAFVSGAFVAVAANVCTFLSGAFVSGAFVSISFWN